MWRFNIILEVDRMIDLRGMYKAEVDKQRKIVFVELEDEFSIEQSYEAIKDFWSKMASVGREAFIVCDITNFKNGSRGSRVILQKVMKLVESYEPKAVIRIINGYSGAMTFDRAYSAVKANYKVYRVEDKEKAMAVVDSLSLMPPVFKTPPSVN